MVAGRLEIGVRGSIWSSDFITGAGAPGGVRGPWPSTATSDSMPRIMTIRIFVFMRPVRWLDCDRSRRRVVAGVNRPGRIEIRAAVVVRVVSRGATKCDHAGANVDAGRGEWTLSDNDAGDGRGGKEEKQMFCVHRSRFTGRFGNG